jgi:cystathionine beta-lyase
MSFDEVIDRRDTWSLKWDDPLNGEGAEDVIPLWVADMDFPPPETVLKAIRSRAEHPIFGYTRLPEGYASRVAAWQREGSGCDAGPECYLVAPGVMPALGMAIRELVRRGEGIVVTPPVYRPFFDIVKNNGRILIEAPLSIEADGRMRLDASTIDEAIREARGRGIKAKAILISNPHNPGGRAWNEAELGALVELAEAEDLMILSDEIHQDIVFSPARMTSLLDGRFGQASARRVIVFSGPNKTFNLAGLPIAHAACRNPELRARMRGAFRAAGFGLPNAFSLTAAMEAYASGRPWLCEMLSYVAENLERAARGIEAALPGSRARPPEATYLLWIDAREPIRRLGLEDDRALAERLAKEGRVRLMAGSIFGKGGEGFLRLNAACPRATLLEGIERIRAWHDRARNAHE